MRKTRKTAAVVALYTFLMLGSVSVVRADQPVTREQISSEQTETKTDSSAQTTESEATTETTTQTTQAKPTTEATTHTHTAATTHTTAAATHTKKHTAATHTKKQKTKSDQDKKKDKKDKKNKKKDKKSIIPKVYNDHSLEMKDKKETIQGFIYFNQADAGRRRMCKRRLSGSVERDPAGKARSAADLPLQDRSEHISENVLQERSRQAKQYVCNRYGGDRSLLSSPEYSRNRI